MLGEVLEFLLENGVKQNFGLDYLENVLEIGSSRLQAESRAIITSKKCLKLAQAEFQTPFSGFLRGL